MTLEPQQTDASTQNVDEIVNTTAPIVNFKVHHWTELKSSTFSVDYEMVFSKESVPIEKHTGMVKTLNCCLNSAQTALGEKAVSRLVHFDKNYLKFQVATLLRDILFECADDIFDEEEANNQYAVISELIIAALTDYRAAYAVCVDDLSIKKVTPKAVTQYLKDVVYKP